MSMDKNVALLHKTDYFKFVDRFAIGALVPNSDRVLAQQKQLLVIQGVHKVLDGL